MRVDSRQQRKEYGVKKYNSETDGDIVHKNGKVFMNRVCPSCGKTHFHGDNMCVACRNAEHKERYGYNYQKKKYSVGEIQREKKLKEQTERIGREMKAIEAAGLSPIHSTVEEIEEAGVELEGFNWVDLVEVLKNDKY